MKVRLSEDQARRVRSCVSWIKRHPKPGIDGNSIHLTGLDFVFPGKHAAWMAKELDSWIVPDLKDVAAKVLVGK